MLFAHKDTQRERERDDEKSVANARRRRVYNNAQRMIDTYKTIARWGKEKIPIELFPIRQSLLFEMGTDVRSREREKYSNEKRETQARARRRTHLTGFQPERMDFHAFILYFM
jgi:hypothetical protein